jgi:hypothetical protein
MHAQYCNDDDDESTMMMMLRNQPRPRGVGFDRARPSSSPVQSSCAAPRRAAVRVAGAGGGCLWPSSPLT